MNKQTKTHYEELVEAEWAKRMAFDSFQLYLQAFINKDRDYGFNGYSGIDKALSEMGIKPYERRRDLLESAIGLQWSFKPAKQNKYYEKVGRYTVETFYAILPEYLSLRDGQNGGYVEAMRLKALILESDFAVNEDMEEQYNVACERWHEESSRAVALCNGIHQLQYLMCRYAPGEYIKIYDEKGKPRNYKGLPPHTNEEDV